MPKVYSYRRFSDPKQASGSSAGRQDEYARVWSEKTGYPLDESLTMRDDGLSAYHQRNISHGALGVFLRAVEDGLIEAGSILVVEGLDRLSRAEPILALSQFIKIIHAGVVVVTAMDGREYSREGIKANSMDLMYSLMVMSRAHEESHTKSKRVRAAIRRQCEGWVAGTWRGIIRNGKDPHWVTWTGSAFELLPERAEALRFAIDRFLAGWGAVQIVREMAARGMRLTDNDKLGAGNLYKTLAKRLLVGEREIAVGGESYRLAGYYPPLLSEAEFDALQLALARRTKTRGPGQIPSIITGMGIARCGYCGGAIVTKNIMHRKRLADGSLQPGFRRIMCNSYSTGSGCPVPGSVQAAPVETALMLYCADSMRMDALINGGDQGQAQRAELAASRRRLAEAEAMLARLAAALATDDGAVPITLLKQMRELEAQTELEKESINGLERELGSQRPAASPDMAEKWLALMQGVESLDTDARMQARELTRASFARIVIWHAGDPAVGDGVIDMELTARGGGSMRIRVDKATGGLID